MNIYVDSREPEKTFKTLSLLGYKVERKPLEIGDVLIGDFCIEIKTPNDFVGSMLSDRLWEQLYNLSNYKRRLLLIKGSVNDLYNKSNISLFYTGLATAILSYQIPVVTVNEEDLLLFFNAFIKKMNSLGEGLKPILIKKKNRTLNEKREDILCCLDGIGRKRAKEILSKASFKDLIRMSYSELRRLGIGIALANEIYTVFST